MRSDFVVFAVFLLAAIGFTIAAFAEHVHADRVLALAKEGLYDTSPAEVLGPSPRAIGPADAPYTLVEFGDYQCPPCRMTNPQVEALIAKYHRSMRFVFRNLPLTTIHPLAMQAAIIADEAEPAQYWTVHNQLYAGPVLTPGMLATAAQIVESEPGHRSSENAQSAVAADEAEAQALGVGGTPTFVLCCPGGTVRRIGRLGDVTMYTTSAGAAPQ